MRTLRSAIVIVLLLLVAPAVVRAQPLAEQVPGDALLYIGWAGGDALAAKYKGTHLQSVVEQSNLGAFVTDFVPRLLEKAGENNQGLKPMANLLGPVLPVIGKYPTAFALESPSYKDNAPQFRCALLCQAGNDADAVYKKLKELFPTEPEGDVPLYLTPPEKGLLMIRLGVQPEGPDDAHNVRRQVPTLAQEPDFKAAVGKVEKDPALVLYISQRALAMTGAPMMDLAEPDPLAPEGTPGDANERASARKEATALGFTGVHGLVVASNFDGKDWVSHLYIAAPEKERAGVFALLSKQPLDTTLLENIPKTAATAGALRFSVRDALAELRSVIVKATDGGPGDYDEAMKQFTEMVGKDVWADFTAGLGDQWGYYTDKSVGGVGALGLVVLHKPRDAAKLEKSMPTLIRLLAKAMSSEFFGEEMDLPVQTTESDGLTIHYIGTPAVSPAWAFKNGMLYIGLYPQTVASAATLGVTKESSILTNKSFTDRMNEANGGKVSSFAWADLEQTAPVAYPGVLLVSRLLGGVADMQGLNAPAMFLPPLHKLTKELSPVGAFAWTEADGWHARLKEPFPGAAALTQEPAVLGGLFYAAGSIIEDTPLGEIITAITEPQNGGGGGGGGAVPQPAMPPGAPGVMPINPNGQ